MTLQEKAIKAAVKKRKLYQDRVQEPVPYLQCYVCEKKIYRYRVDVVTWPNIGSFDLFWYDAVCIDFKIIGLTIRHESGLCHPECLDKAVTKIFNQDVKRGTKIIIEANSLSALMDESPDIVQCEYTPQRRLVTEMAKGGVKEWAKWKTKR